MKTTEEVVNHHLQAISEDLDSLLSDYDEKSCIMGPLGIFKGLVEIRAFFATFMEGMPAGLMESLKINRLEFYGELAYMAWEAKPLWPTGADTFIVREGKILYQTFAIHVNE